MCGLSCRKCRGFQHFAWSTEKFDLCLFETLLSPKSSLSFDVHLHHLKRWIQEMKERTKGELASTFPTGISIRKDNCNPWGYFRLIPYMVDPMSALSNWPCSHSRLIAYFWCVKVVKTNIAIDSCTDFINTNHWQGVWEVWIWPLVALKVCTWWLKRFSKEQKNINHTTVRRNVGDN